MSSHHAPHTIETLIFARQVDVTDPAGITTLCREHAVAETGLRAMIDAFGPLSETLCVYLTR